MKPTKKRGFGRHAEATPTKQLDPPGDILKAANAARRKVEDMHEARRLREELADLLEQDA